MLKEEHMSAQIHCESNFLFSPLLMLFRLYFAIGNIASYSVRYIYNLHGTRLSLQQQTRLYVLPCLGFCTYSMVHTILASGS